MRNEVNTQTANQRINETRKMNCGMNATIVAYRKYSDMDVVFENGVLKQHVAYNSFQAGEVSPNACNRNRPVYATHLEDTTKNMQFTCAKECATQWKVSGSDIAQAIKRKIPIQNYLLSYDGYIANTQEMLTKNPEESVFQYDWHPPKPGNSLAEKRPDIAKEWHPTKNHPLTPNNVTVSSNKNVFWLAPCGHTYDRPICQRTNKDSGCPICSGRKIVAGENDLGTTHSEMLQFWDYEKNTIQPTEVSHGSNKTVWWKCPKCKHSWQARINNKTNGVTTCPKCNCGILPTEGRGSVSFAEKCPNLVKEWHPTKNGLLCPEDVSYGSSISVWWKCELGHEWEEQVADRAKGGGCTYCAGKRAWPGFNDLETTYPKIAAEWHPTKNGTLSPKDVTAGSGKKVWWVGACGHAWQATISSRTGPDKTGCPICHNLLVEVGFNDLAFKYPDIAKQWHHSKNGTLTPQDVVFGSCKKVWWQCPICGHEWQASIRQRTIDGTGCPHCTNQTSYNEQALYYYIKMMCPDACNRAKINGIEVDIFIPSLNIVGEYDGYHHNVTRVEHDIRKTEEMHRQGLHFLRIREPKCAQLPPNASMCWTLSSLQEKDVEDGIRWILQQICILYPDLLMPDVNLCRDNAHIHEQLTRTKRSNSIAECSPQLLEEWDWEKNGILKPDMVAKSSNRKVWWKCKHGHSWQSAPNSRRAGNGCPYCRKEAYKIVATNINDSTDQIVFELGKEAAAYFDIPHGNISRRIRDQKPVSGYILNRYQNTAP